MKHIIANWLYALLGDDFGYDARDEEVKRLRKALEFYANIKNFAVTVWETEAQDGACHYEPAEDHGLGEIYGPSSTGDFGITAMEALEHESGK